MTRGKTLVLLATILAFFLSSAQPDPVQDVTLSLPQAMAATALELGRKLPRGDRVAVVDFTELSGKPLLLCSYWAESLTGELARQGRLRMVERRMLTQILAEQKLQASDITQPAVLSRAGQILKVEWIITGTITDLGERVEFNSRALNVKSGKVGAASLVRVWKRDVAAMMSTPQAPTVTPASAAPAEQELSLTVSFLARPAAGPADGPILAIMPGTELHSGDRIKILFTASRDCYVYIMQRGSTGTQSVVFPNPQIAQSNKIMARQEYSIPAGDQWFYLDSNPGHEALYVIASLEPLDNIDLLVKKMNQPQQEKKLSQDLTNEIDGLFRSRGVGQAQLPIDTTGTSMARERNIGGVTTAEPLPLPGTSAGPAGPPAITISGAGMVARHIEFEHR